MRRDVALRCGVVLAGMLTALAASASGQVDTGRHRRPMESPVAATGPQAPTRWVVLLQGGIMSSGDLLSVRTPAASGVPWTPPAGSSFVSDEFLLTLNEDASFGIGVERIVNDWLAVRGDASFSRLEVTAEARIGETVKLLPYDEISLAVYSLSAELKLVRNPSFPYLLGGAAVTVLSGSGDGAFDQTRAGLRVGGGYHQDLGHRLGLRGEVRTTIQQFQFADYVPPYEGTVRPDAAIRQRGPQQLWELQIGIAGQF